MKDKYIRCDEYYFNIIIDELRAHMKKHKFLMGWGHHKEGTTLMFKVHLNKKPTIGKKGRPNLLK